MIRGVLTLAVLWLAVTLAAAGLATLTGASPILLYPMAGLALGVGFTRWRAAR